MRVENLSTKQPIVLADTVIAPGAVATLMPPVRLGVGDSFIEVETGLPEEIEHDALQTVMQPVRGPIHGGGAPDPAVAEFGADARGAYPLVRGGFAVQRTTPASPEYYEQTAKALVDLVGLDSGLVLLRNGDAWRRGGPGVSRRGRARPGVQLHHPAPRCA